MSLLRSATVLETTLLDLLPDLQACMPQTLEEDVNISDLLAVLSTILAHILRGDVSEHRPLVDRLAPGRLLMLERLLGTVYTDELSRGGALQDGEGFRSWFTVRKRTPEQPINHERHLRAQETTELTALQRNLTKERAERQEHSAWSTDAEKDYEREMEEIKLRNKALLDVKKLLLQRTRKYRLFPTRSRQKTLRQFMGTCRWTYNQAVAHYRKTNDFNAINLTAHYVTKNTRETLAYPEGMGRPPEWAHDTPASIRGNVMLKVDALKEISSEIDILYSNGVWYVAIPETVEPDPYKYRKSYIALDPGMKAFMTGVDLEGNVLEFRRGNKTRLEAVRDHLDAAQSAMATFKNQKGKSKRWQYRTYVRAKRTFLSCTVKMKNLVKDLHYKTCTYLIEHYDVILLAIFKTKDMVKKSSARTHGFNMSILSLNHFKFRQLLQAKCEVRCKSTVVCSEMYTRRTCGQCYRLYVNLDSNDVFASPHCDYRAGRDANAALNIMRYVIDAIPESDPFAIEMVLSPLSSWQEALLHLQAASAEAWQPTPLPYAASSALAVALQFLLVIVALTWLASVATLNYSHTDRLWSVTPFLFAWHFAYHAYLADSGVWDARLVLMAALTTLWGARLSFNFWRKGGYKLSEEDYRWAVLRQHMHWTLFQLFNAVFIAGYQHLLLLLLVLPSYAAYLHRDEELNAMDGAATALFLVLLALETAADQQQWTFYQEKYALLATKQPLSGDFKAGFNRSGLFRYSRHPNFFAEFSLWWAFYLFSVAASNAAFNPSSVGAILLTLLFQGSTAFTEYITVSKYPLYKQYQRRVSALIPWFPSSAALAESDDSKSHQE
ncbi:hypothetical protein BBJ28_00005515 [Nothophytophthora sp. Chile5]|nr:hypothetical protein BBJ28_00005515 [Nothophytophthora sp. Chile5]